MFLQKKFEKQKTLWGNRQKHRSMLGMDRVNILRLANIWTSQGIHVHNACMMWIPWFQETKDLQLHGMLFVIH
jgi:hypothetical protein